MILPLLIVIAVLALADVALLAWAMTLRKRILALTQRADGLAGEAERSQQSSHEVLDALPHVVAVLSPEGRFLFVNEAGKRYFDFKTDDELSELPMKSLNALVSQVRRTGQRAEPRGFETAIQIFYESAELFFLPQAIPLMDAHGKLAGITLLLVDATELREIDEAKSNLISSVSHDLKTPLTSMQMAVHLLLENTENHLSARELDLLNAAREDTDRLHHFIQQLLDKRRNMQQAALETKPE